MANMTSAKEVAKTMADDATHHFNKEVDCSRVYVTENPLLAVGYAVAAGFLLGLFISRR